MKIRHYNIGNAIKIKDDNAGLKRSRNGWRTGDINANAHINRMIGGSLVKMNQGEQTLERLHGLKYELRQDQRKTDRRQTGDPLCELLNERRLQSFNRF